MVTRIWSARYDIKSYFAAFDEILEGRERRIMFVQLKLIFVQRRIYVQSLIKHNLFKYLETAGK